MRKGDHIVGGFIVAAIGVLLLLGKFGVIGWSVFGALWQIWPVILIAVGINLVFNNHFLVRILTLTGVIASLVLYGVFFPGGGEVKWDSSGFRMAKPVEMKLINRSYPMNDTVKKASISLGIPAGTLNIDSSTNLLVDARYPENLMTVTNTWNSDHSAQNFQFEPNSTLSHIQELEAIGQANKLNFNYKLNSDIPWDITIESGAIHSNLDLSKITLDQLSLSAGAGDLQVKVGSVTPSASFTADTGTANMQILIPKKQEFRLTVDGGIRNVTIDGRKLDGKEDVYVSPGYAQAASRLDLKLSVGVGNIAITRE